MKYIEQLKEEVNNIESNLGSEDNSYKLTKLKNDIYDAEMDLVNQRFEFLENSNIYLIIITSVLILSNVLIAIHL